MYHVYRLTRRGKIAVSVNFHTEIEAYGWLDKHAVRGEAYSIIRLHDAASIATILY